VSRQLRVGLARSSMVLASSSSSAELVTVTARKEQKELGCSLLCMGVLPLPFLARWQS
jgi:hypothetical protein